MFRTLILTPPVPLKITLTTQIGRKSIRRIKRIRRSIRKTKRTKKIRTSIKTMIRSTRKSIVIATSTEMGSAAAISLESS